MSTVAPHQALLLNANYAPMAVIPWERAVYLLIDEVADLVQGYIGKAVRSASAEMPWPAVLRMRRFVKSRSRVRFNRLNVLARDGFQCCYCGAKPRLSNGKPRREDLTLDHVVPRSKAKNHMVTLPWNGKRVPVTCWENIVCCCQSCNHAKADRTPEQAEMKLHWIPTTPTTLDVVRIRVQRSAIPNEWLDYIPESWRQGADPNETYWDVELDQD